MGKFCTSCGTALNNGAKFCAKCGANAFQSNESAQISSETPPEAAKSKQEIPKTMNNTKKPPPINRASDDAPQHSPMGVGKFIIAYIRQSLKVLKNPKQMLPTALLGLVWLVLALLGSFGINPLPVRILSFLTFAQGELSNESCNRDVWNFETEGMYFEKALDPGETSSGWMVFQLKPDEKEIIMKYNVLYDTVKFKLPIA